MRIKAIREELGYTQLKMAELMDIDRVTYFNFEHGYTGLDRHLKSFMEITGSSFADIFGEEDSSGGYLNEASIFDRLDEISDQLREIKSLLQAKGPSKLRK